MAYPIGKIIAGMRKTQGIRHITHGGGTMGFATLVSFFPDKQLGVVMISNGTGGHLVAGMVQSRLLELWFDIDNKAQERLDFALTAQREELAKLQQRSSVPKAGWIGGAAGFLGAWESIPEFDEYLRRAGGITVGPRVRLGLLGDRADVVLGVDFQLSNLSEFGRPGEKTLAPGLATRITFNYVFR